MSQTIITKRLSRDKTYKPPENTYQSTLSDADIAKKLEDYTRVKTSEIFKIPIGTHIRYFTINPKTGEKQFRLGGNLTKYGENGEYIVCSNGTYSWSIQLSNSIIYKKLSISELKENTKKVAIDDSKKEIDDLIKENKELKKMIKEIKEATISAKKIKKK
jgi:hypothetical protein